MSNVTRLLAAVVAIVFVSATFADAAHVIMVSAKGSKQGQFKGESARAKSQDKIEALGFTFEVTSPRDAASGQASGKRTYKPLQIIKPIGASSPQFFQALTTNEPLPAVTLEFTKTNANGEEFIFYTIKLVNASVSSIRQHTPAVPADAKQTMPQMEEISFTFQRIEIENKESKVMAVDDWYQGS